MPSPAGVEGDARQVGGQQHVPFGPALPRRFPSGAQVLPGQGKRLLRQGVGVGRGPAGHVGLGGMGEYVHARVRRHGGGYPRQQGGVQNGLGRAEGRRPPGGT